MFVPYHLEDQYDAFMRIGPFILLALIFFESFLPIPLLSGWVHGIMAVVLSVFELLAGLVW
jgi:hypothetical protein